MDGVDGLGMVIPSASPVSDRPTGTSTSMADARSPRARTQSDHLRR